MRDIVREARQFSPKEFRILASQTVIDRFLEEESQHLATPVSYTHLHPYHGRRRIGSGTSGRCRLFAKTLAFPQGQGLYHGLSLIHI